VVISKKKQSKNCDTFDKNCNGSCDMAEFCHNSCSKCSSFCLHTYVKTSMPLVNCTVNDGLVKAMPNAASVHNTYLDKIVCYLQRIFNRTRYWNNKQVSKLSALKLGVFSKINACYIFVCIFFHFYAKTQTFNFCKVVWQHTEGMVVSIIRILFYIYFSFR